MEKLFYKFIGFSLSVYSIHTYSNLIHTFSALKTEHFYISFTIHISRSHGKNIPLSIMFTLLQLHHCTLLIKLTSITSLHHNYNMCSKLTLGHSNIPSHSAVFVHPQIHSDFQLPHLPSTFVSLPLNYVPYSISNYIWNTSKLLLLSDDVKINPGLQPIGQNPVFCSICSNKINWGIQQDMAPTCFKENCNAQCHQTCNGLSISQTRHAKNPGPSVTWKCPQHGTGIAKIIVPPASVYELPNRPFAVGKSCSVCRNPIRTRFGNLAYHCANPSCDNACHLAATCSGFVNPWGISRARALSTRIGNCRLHSSQSATTHPSSPPDNSPPRPTPPSFKSLLNQGLSLADAKSSKEKCAKCSATLRSNTVSVRCSVCSKEFHQKCSTGPKASTHDNYWKCVKCSNIQENLTSESTNCHLPGSTNWSTLPVERWRYSSKIHRTSRSSNQLWYQRFGCSGLETTEYW